MAMSIFGLLGVGGCEKPASQQSSMTGPNVVFVVWDTVRADRMSCYGYETPTTPHLDRFAESAALYENAVSPAMWTLPAHASMFTGLPISAHGTTSEHLWLDDSFDCLAEIFQRAGYGTYFFSANPHVSKERNFTQGFDQAEYPADDQWKNRIQNLVLERLLPKDQSTKLFQNINRARTAGPDRMKRRLGTSKDAGPVIAEALEHWLDGRNTNRPFFAFLNYMEAHYPRLPSPAARKQAVPENRIENTYALDQSFPRMLGYMFGYEKFTEEELLSINDVYNASLVDLDSATHALFEMLRKRGILDNTIVVLTSDHGENLGDHGLMEHRYCLYDSLIRVPLLLRYPPRLSPRRVKSTVSTLDIYRTVLDLAGLKPIADPYHSKSLLRDESQLSDRWGVMSELLKPDHGRLKRFAEDHPDFDQTKWLKTYRSIERTPHKLILSSDENHELFDVVNDPGETKDLFSELPEVALQLEAALQEWVGSFDHYKPDKSSRPELSKETIEQLRNLGYAQ
jgi:arylsulfatase A-like enzyme